MTTSAEPPDGQAVPPTESVRPRISSRELVRQAHLRNAAKPIMAPNEYGVFSDSRQYAGWPVVVDANVLFRDIAKACRQEHRTILVNVANSGTVRLFCTQHVLDEVAEHAAEFTSHRRIPLEAYIRRWESDYLPLLHLVDPEEGLLDPGEAERIAILDHGPAQWCDPDDVPSATLAIQLGAFFLSTDKKPLRAVYGPGVDLKRHDGWVAVLGAAGNSSEFGELLRPAIGISELAVRGGAAGVKWVWHNVSPWAVAGIAAVAGFSLWTATPEARRRLLRGTGAVAGFVGELAVEQQLTSAEFNSMLACVPAWADLAQTVPAEVVRARACLHTLARSPMPDRSAAELAADLPALPVSTSETAVRKTLRRHGCFREVYQGRWQLGGPADESWKNPMNRTAPEIRETDT